MKKHRVLHLRYNEDLKKNPESAILKISTFLGYNQMTPEDVRKIKEVTSYENMKVSHPNKVHTNTQGKSGTYKSKLTEQNIKDINTRIAEFCEKWKRMNVDLSMYCKES